MCIMYAALNYLPNTQLPTQVNSTVDTDTMQPTMLLPQQGNLVHNQNSRLLYGPEQG